MAEVVVVKAACTVISHSASSLDDNPKSKYWRKRNDVICMPQETGNNVGCCWNVEKNWRRVLYRHGISDRLISSDRRELPAVAAAAADGSSSSYLNPAAAAVAGLKQP